MAKKINLEEEFNRIVKEHEEIETILFGAITKDATYPQVGVAGNGFDTVILLAAIIRNLAHHVDDSVENILGIIYEMLQDIEKDAKKDVKS